MSSVVGYNNNNNTTITEYKPLPYYLIVTMLYLIHERSIIRYARKIEYR